MRRTEHTVFAPLRSTDNTNAMSDRLDRFDTNKSPSQIHDVASFGSRVGVGRAHLPRRNFKPRYKM